MVRAYRSRRSWLFLVLISLAAIGFSVGLRFAFASTTDGTIDAASKYAWGEKIGWVNFGTVGGDVHITDAALTGYAWSEQYGWINLAPTGSGVTNDSNGTLSGSAWGENLGYIDFSGVTINASGQFTGHASGTNVGQLNFDCTNCTVLTDWRPASARGSSGSGGGGTGGGGGTAPATLGVLINANAPTTNSPAVTLQLSYDPSISYMFISNFADFHDAVLEPVRPTKDWNICQANGVTPTPGQAGCTSNSVYTVYVRFYNNGGNPYGPYTDSIFYGTPPVNNPLQVPPPTTPPASGNGTTPNTGSSGLLDAIGKILESFLPDFLRPHQPPIVVIKPPVIPITPPFAFQDKWNLLPEQAIHEFVFAPLPSDFALLIKKFPQLQRITQDIGILRQADLQKLYGITLALPGFTGTSLQKSFENLKNASPQEVAKLREVVLKLPGFTPSALPDVKVAGGKLTLPPGVPLAKLPVELKNSVPSEVIFARTGDEKVDLDIGVRLNAKGQVEQQINTISGSLLKLVVRPQYPAERVTGYLAFTSRGNKATSFNSPSVTSMLGNILSQTRNSDNAAGNQVQPDSRYRIVQGIAAAIETLFGKATPLPTSEDRFTLNEFQYVDPDHDGLYTATIQAPVVDGTYSIYTIITYQDPNIANHEIKLTAVIDPEGYVYEQVAGKETRIPGAVVSMYALDAKTKEYALWPADQYGQENPQTTDVRGTYAFLVPPGYYYTTVTAPGYEPYTGKAFEVVAGSSGVHTNIQLSTKYGWLRAMDWKTFLLVLVCLLLIYNFYKDRRRDAAKV